MEKDFKNITKNLNSSIRPMMEFLSKVVEDHKKGLSPEDLEAFKRHEERVTLNAKNGIITPHK